jgi:DNA-binding transcriptional regulator YhcF (GntR family)
LREQLRGRFESMIVAGKLRPGERVPTVRNLAGELGLAPGTVAWAYRELEAAGLLVSRGRHGTFVCDELPEQPSRAEAALDDAARDYARRARQLGFEPSEAIKRARHHLREDQ